MVPDVRLGIVVSALVLAIAPSYASDDILMLPIANVLSMPEAQQKLESSVRFYFGMEPANRRIRDFGTFVANPKTNAFAKSQNKVCERAFLSALLSLQDRAESVGANAVVNVESFYRKHAVPSKTEYECHKGFLIAGVALRGDVVQLADH
jgi:uncharacterized protein YbjQ (UPF0145 family)